MQLIIAGREEKLALHDQLASLGGHAQLTRCLSVFLVITSSGRWRNAALYRKSAIQNILSVQFYPKRAVYCAVHYYAGCLTYAATKKAEVGRAVE